jgi:hypothetical protein
VQRRTRNSRRVSTVSNLNHRLCLQNAFLFAILGVFYINAYGQVSDLGESSRYGLKLTRIYDTLFVLRKYFHLQTQTLSKTLASAGRWSIAAVPFGQGSWLHVSNAEFAFNVAQYRSMPGAPGRRLGDCEISFYPGQSSVTLVALQSQEQLQYVYPGPQLTAKTIEKPKATQPKTMFCMRILCSSASYA